MANDAKKAKKVRKLRTSTETMRQRAERAATAKPKRGLHLKARLGSFFRKLGSWRLWKPFKFVGRLIARFIIPPYLRNSFRELRSVTWPDRRQTFRLTSAVILFAIIFGFVVAAFDYGLDRLFKEVIIK